MNRQLDTQTITPSAEPQNSAENPQKHRHRWGKIPNLPTKIRLQINQAIRDDVSYTKILQDLAAAGFGHINHDNLCNWVKTGYADWLRDQQHFEKLVLTTDAARIKKAPRTNRKNYRDLTDLDVAVLLNSAAREFNLEKLREEIHGKPDAFFRLVTAQALHERNAILRDRNEIELKKVAAKNKAKKRAAAPKAIPTRMDIERYKRDLKIVAPEHQPIEYREPTSSLTPA